MNVNEALVRPKHSQCKDKTFPLLHAIVTEAKETVETLLSGEDSEISTQKDAFGVNALHLAAYQGNVQLVQILLKKVKSIFPIFIFS